ncbi:MAG: DUF2508 family protein [Clostridia bacterium]|nr:DUF2508 family protein [Clostridia bacterium]
MDIDLKYFLAGKLKRNDEGPTREEKLLEDIRTLKREMDAAYMRFEYCDDEDLVEAAIFELESLKRRYHRLIKIAKEENIESSDITVCYEPERRYFG